ncbi:MotA/TolQ/ExbB proton channel family protein [Vreelandella aquamarina]|uniref:MotA/TolQ/ExbB proton channel family protein n=1 Tax=Halomonadaceae TaxID=28256 RepID=UPI001D17B95C|nr:MULTISPECIES: MotA/TolQ/ExbB proton channel family protein [Halomonas]MCC4290065.1 MotA/TolQ/ExbB proton channel family protein [Halomonas axialensis]MCF2911402.1 MotA/TolQ/ExbB proton channel family protein [Halomonas sp. Cn5-12]MDK2751562.1 MotA/TolQ/ExbB proton channel family protein [Halomonas meridiana]
MSLFSRPKAWLCLTLLVGTLTSSAAMAQSDELGSLREAREAAQARDQARLQSFLEDQDGLEAALEEARAAHEAAEEEQAALEAQQDEQSEQAQALAQRQEEQGEALTSLLADLARHSEEIRNELGGDSWLTLEADALPPRLNDVDVLERSQIEAVVDSLATLTVNTGRAERLELPVADASGDIASHSVVRLGDFAAFTESALLRKGQDEESSLAEVPRTPTAISDLLAAYHQGESREFAIDPTQGSVLEALAQQPTLWERFQQGGYVGYVVVVLGGIGLLVALAQYIYLLTVSARVRRQRQNLDQPSKDNPLGRVLERFKEMDKHQTPEALEARLDEAVLAELPKIERGQPIVKLLAAIAPLLGLLGTVTGMIVTFQAITVFGTGDPQLMAGGISQALVTTVLGLVTAVPLLFAQTALSSRSRFITQVIEGEASATLADHLEAQFTLSGQTVN